MAKVFAGLVSFVILIGIIWYTSFVGNRDLIDTTYHYNYGIIQLADGTIVEGTVNKWRDYENSDMIQITIDGETYLVHMMNASMRAK